MRITDIIKQEIETFKQPVETADGLKSDHYDTIKRINLYMNDQFYDCPDPDAIFWNLGKPRSPHFAKKIDLDTKNFRAEAQGDNNAYQGWIINMRFQRWCRDSGFALDLNDLSEGCADYGSLVMKLMEEDGHYKLKECDFTKLFFNTVNETLDGKTVIEIHQLTEFEIRSMKGWDNVDEIIKNANKVPGTEASGMTPKYEIAERVGEYEKDGKLKFRHTICCGEGDKEVIAYEKEIDPKDSHYYDFHISKYRGQFLRVGVYQRLFALNERVNTLVNENAANSAIASLLLMASTDKSLIGKNVLKEAITGQIFNTNDLRQIGITSTYLNGFLQEMMLIENQADRLCMTSDFVTGDEVPKGLTFRGQAAATNAATSSFKNARDRIGYQVSRVLMNKILPNEVKNWNREEIFEMAGNEQDVRLFDAIQLIPLVNEFIKSEWAKGNNPTKEEIEQFKAETVKGFDMWGRKIKTKDFFNFKYGFILNPTGENVNKEQKNDVYSNALMMYQTNPAIANNPIFRQYLEDNGVSPFKINQDEMEKYMQMQTMAPQQGNMKQDALSATVDTQ